MDNDDFDLLTKRFAAAGTSRRRLLQLFGGGVAGGILGVAVRRDSDAFICRQPGVLCTIDAHCCSHNCFDYHCACPGPNQRVCRDRSCADCCDDRECSSGDVCCNGVCQSGCLALQESCETSNQCSQSPWPDAVCDTTGGGICSDTPVCCLPESANCPPVSSCNCCGIFSCRENADSTWTCQ